MKTRNIAGFVFLVAVLALAGYALADEETEFKMQEAREALNQAQYKKAAEMYEQLYALEEGQEAAGNALYWWAFAKYKLHRTNELREAVELLQLQQEEYETAETAAEGEALLARLYGELARRGEAHAVREIHELSDDEMQHEATRVAALEALMRMDPEKALPILEKIVTGEKEASEDMRHHSLFILCRMDDQRSEDLLISMVQKEDDPEMLSELVMCLSQIGNDRALDAIVDLLQRVDDPEIDEAAMFAIGRHGGDRAFKILSDIVLDPKNDAEKRQQALFGLSHSGHDEEVADIAVEILKSDQDPEMLETALYALSRSEGKVSNQVFIDLINNPQADEELRSQALFFASRRGQLDLAFLREIYAKTDSHEMKQQICHAITQMDDEEMALDALIEIVRMEDDPEIKKEAVFWISRFDNDRAAEFLLEVINDQ